MPNGHDFQHLPLILRYQGPAKLFGGPAEAVATQQNKQNRGTHSANLRGSTTSLIASWQTRQAQRAEQDLPTLTAGIPILLEVDPSLDLDRLRHFFDFEIVSEEEEGFVIVASQDLNLPLFLQRVNDFATEVRGSATVASIHRLDDDPDQTERLRCILSERLFQQWPTMQDNQTYLVDVGITCLGMGEIPARPKRGKRDSDGDWARKEQEWANMRAEAYQAWDDIKSSREEEIQRIVVTGYAGEILKIVDDADFEAAELPDSFTVRVRVAGRGLRDFVLNYPFIFEVVEPDNVELPQQQGEAGAPGYPAAALVPPADQAPTVCVIDSGIQEGHVLLAPAIDNASSYCFLPGRPRDIADYIRPGGHGTRVAGAVLFGEVIPKIGSYGLPCWIQNARVLADNGKLPTTLFPPALMRAVVEAYHLGSRGTRLFNHSINASCHCRLRHMSSWAAEIDMLCHQYDILVVQSVGNLFLTAMPPSSGIMDHLAAGRNYPNYLMERSSRIADPAQSLQALTVGSVAYTLYQGTDWRSFAGEVGRPSSFSRSGLGIWDVIKPEVVEFAGDYLRNNGSPPLLATPTEGRDCYPELIRSTLYGPGPLYDRDVVGTSYAAPKVTHIAAHLQRLLPDEPCLLYRALIVQSARWPDWTQTAVFVNPTTVLRSIGYGVPDLERATRNTDYRTTFISRGEADIRAGECHVYQVPIPETMRMPGDDYDILIEVTLSYTAQPRRTRRNLRRYLSTWVDWKSSRLRESIDSFRRRALRDQDDADLAAAAGTALPWTLDTRTDRGEIEGVRRTAGTVQKDWAIVKSNALPVSFCIAIVGHQGWSQDPDSVARYAVVVSFEILGREIPIYNDLQVAVQELQAEIEVETEAEVDLESEAT